MFIYNTKSKVIHQQSCRFVKHIKPGRKNICTDIPLEIQNGLRFCENCSSVGKAYKKEKTDVDSFSKENKIICTYKNGCLEVRTPYEKWLIVPRSKKRLMELYHKNATHRKGHYINAYHKQNVTNKSIMPLLKHVVEHNEYKRRDFTYYYKNRRKTFRECKSERKRKNVDNMKNVELLLDQIKESKNTD